MYVSYATFDIMLHQEISLENPKWFYVAKWFHMAKWQKVAKGDEKWGKVAKSG